MVQSSEVRAQAGESVGVLFFLEIACPVQPVAGVRTRKFFFLFRNRSFGPQFLDGFQSKTIQCRGASFRTMPYGAGFQLIGQFQQSHAQLLIVPLISCNF
jgi:hypothetical protein